MPPGFLFSWLISSLSSAAGADGNRSAFLLDTEAPRHFGCLFVPKVVTHEQLRIVFRAQFALKVPTISGQLLAFPQPSPLASFE